MDSKIIVYSPIPSRVKSLGIKPDISQCDSNIKKNENHEVQFICRPVPKLTLITPTQRRNSLLQKNHPSKQ